VIDLHLAREQLASVQGKRRRAAAESREAARLQDQIDNMFPNLFANLLGLGQDEPPKRGRVTAGKLPTVLLLGAPLEHIVDRQRSKPGRHSGETPG
jgi:hypothetical protein